jgi:hypothetical protein
MQSLTHTNALWYGKIIAVLSHEIQNECIQVLIKVQWYDLYQENTYPKPHTYKLSKMYDIISPASIRSHCTVIKTSAISEFYEDNNDIVYICNIFSKYYVK